MLIKSHNQDFQMMLAALEINLKTHYGITD